MGAQKLSAIMRILFVWVVLTGSAVADILPGKPSVQFNFGGSSFAVSRADDNSVLPDKYARVGRACPPNCIEPAQAASGVGNFTELEVLAFMEGPVNAGKALMIDARLPEDYASGSLPGAISVPAATLVSGNPYREDLLLALGAKGTLGSMDFSGAFDLMVFDDGPWSPTARTAIERLISAGYPAQKLFYYRGGLQMWHVFGLTVSK